MDENLQRQLHELAQHLHQQDTEQARELEAELERALESGERHGLTERLKDAEVHFEVDHPGVAEVIRRVVDALSAAGI